MPLFDSNGVQEDRGYQSCSEDCRFKMEKCLNCLELGNGGELYFWIEGRMSEYSVENVDVLMLLINNQDNQK